MGDIKVSKGVINSDWLERRDCEVRYEATLDIEDGGYVILNASSWAILIEDIQAISERLVVTSVRITSTFI